MNTLSWHNQTVSGGTVTVVTHYNDSLRGIKTQTLRTQLINIIASQQSDLIFDMSLTKFLDSMGLTVLVAGLRTCRQLGKSFKICGLQPQCKLVFSTTGMDAAFEVFETVDEAVGVMA